MRSNALPTPKPAALKAYRFLALAFLGYALFLMAFAMYSLIVHVNQPYGGFLWSWANTHGLHKVDHLSHESSGNLQPADFILAIEGQTTPPRQMYQLAQTIYQRHANVCSANPPPEAILITYTIERRGQQEIIEAPVYCFTWITVIRIALMPMTFALLLFGLACLFYWANPNQELTLTLTILMSLLACVAASHTADTWGIDENWINLIGAFGATNLIYGFITAFTLHLITIFPSQYPSMWLYRLRFWWYRVIPLGIIAFSTLCFILGQHWHPLVGSLTVFVGSFVPGSFIIIMLIILVRYTHIYRMTTSLQVKNQLKTISGSIIFLIFLGILTIIKEFPKVIPWFPVNENAFTLLIFLPFIGITFAIIRYQAFPRRVIFFRLLTTVGLAISTSLVFSTLLLWQAESREILLFIALIFFNTLWVFPNPMQRVLQRFTNDKTVEATQTEQFNDDIQQLQTPDLDLLALTVVESFAKQLELNFVALWLLHEQSDLLILETTTNKAPLNLLPHELNTAQVWSNSPQRLIEGILAQAGGEISLPLQVDTRKIGLLLLSERWTEEIFTEADWPALTLMAHQTALAMDTARQFRALRRASLQIEQAQLDERQRIATDLHDLTQAQLNQLNFTLEQAADLLLSNPIEAQKILQRGQTRVNQTAQDLRGILRALSNEVWSGLPLSIILQEYVEQAQQLYTYITFILEIESAVDEKLAGHKKSALLRVCRQSLDNALAHAQAKSIKFVIQLNSKQTMVEFSIIDNGRGFVKRSHGDLLEAGHRGLYLMSSRLLEYNGRVEIDSTPGQGTIIKGYLPI